MLADAPPAADTAAHDTLLRIEGLTVRRGDRTVLDGLSLEVARGEIFGIAGPNGAGKSTLFRVLTGLLPMAAGRLTLDGAELDPRDAGYRSRLGVVFQDPALDRKVSARRNLQMAARLYRVPRAEAAGRIERLLERAGLADRGDDPVERLSGGMRRRVELARGLIHEPDLVILDEPTTGLDEGAFRRFWADLTALARERRMTLLVTTHRADEAERCDRLALLDGGRIVACDTPERLRDASTGDWIVMTPTDLDECERVLAGLGFAARRHDQRLLVRRDAAHEAVPRIVEALPDGALRAIEVRRTGLGEVFLELTGHDLDGDTREAAR